MANNRSWKTKTLFVGAAAGMAIGLLAAIIILQQSEKTEQKPQLTAGDGVKVGLSILGVLKLISDMGVRK